MKSDSETPTSHASYLHLQSKKKDTTSFFAEQIMTHTDFEKSYGFQMRPVGGGGDALGVWDGNAVKFGCDDHCKL